jgi:signal transduction histidine kinase
MPAACLAFTRVFPELSEWPSKLAVRTVVALGLLFAMLSAVTPWVAFDFVITPVGTLKRRPGPLFPIFTAYFLLCVGAILGTLAMKWRHARGLSRAQLRHYNVGFSILATGAITTNLVIPALTGHSEYSTVGPFFVLPFVALVAHSIVRHRLLDLNLMIGRGAAFAATITVISTVILSTLALLKLAAFSDHVSLPVPILISLLVTAALSSVPVAPRVARLIDSYLLRGRPDLDQVLKEASRHLSRLLTADEISAELKRVVTSTFAPQTIFISTRSDEIVPTLPDEDELLRTAWDIEGTEPTVRMLGANSATTPAEAKLFAAGIEVWVALGRAGQRMAVMILGPRRDGEAYLSPSLRFLEDLAELASLALDVAYLYRRQFSLESERHRLTHLARMGRAYAGLGHEIRTPLTTISNFVSALPDRIDDPEFRDTMVRLIPAEVARIVQLAERLRQMAPSHDGALAPVALRSLLNDMVAVHAPTFRNRRIEVTVHCKSHIPTIMGDQRQLMQLFVNLLTNAVEASPAGGTVVISAFTRRSFAETVTVVRILDEGCGIAPSLQPRIFQPFFTTKASGTGLGLSICREIAEFHKAKLTVEARTDARGTLAEVEFLPYEAGPQLLAAFSELPKSDHPSPAL